MTPKTTTTGSSFNVTSDTVDQDDSDVSVLAMSYLMYRIGKYMTFLMSYLLFTRKETAGIEPLFV